MSRRLFWNVATEETDLYSATDETGVRVAVPVETAVQGTMRCEAGGSPTSVQEFAAIVNKSGNLGDAEFTVCRNTVSLDCMGSCASWIPDRPVFLETVSGAGANLAGLRLVMDKGRGVVLAAYTDDTSLRFAYYDPTTRTWSTPATIGTVGSIQPTGIVVYEDTGEVVVYCDSTCYSCFNPTAGSPTWIVKGTMSGTVPSWSLDLCNVRGRLVMVGHSNGVVCNLRISYDRGATWQDAESILSFTAVRDTSADVNPLDGQIYLVVIDRIGGVDRALLYVSSDGETWTEIDDDFGSYIALATTVTSSSLYCREDGAIVLLCARDAPNGYLYACVSKDFGISITTATVKEIMLAGNGEFGFIAGVDAGEEAIVLVEFVGDLISVGTRWWATVSEQTSFNSGSYLPSASPTGYAWSGNGTGTETVTDDYVQLETTDANQQKYYDKQIGDATDGDCKMKFGVLPVQNCDGTAQLVGARFRFDDTAGNGYDFGVYVDTGAVYLYDHNAAAQVTFQAFDLTDWGDILVDVEYDAATQVTTVTAYGRHRDSYPLEWTDLFEQTVQNGNAGGGGREILWGNHQRDIGNTTISRWDCAFAGDSAEGCAISSYRNQPTDPYDLTGKRCVRLSQGTMGLIDLAFRGAGAYFGDQWTVATEYAWAKENVVRPILARDWRSDGEYAEKSIIFAAPGNRPYRMDRIALFGKNFDRFYIDLDDAVTFDSGGGGVPEVSVLVGNALAAGDSIATDVLAYVAHYMEVLERSADWIEIGPVAGKGGGLWKGRFDAGQSSGKNWYVRVLDGTGAGKVYRIEAIERINNVGQYAIRLGYKPDGTAPDVVTDGLANLDHVAIFGDSIGFEVPGVREGGYAYMRIRVLTQRTWHADYRLGYVLWGISAQLGGGKETPEPEWDLAQVRGQNVGFVGTPDNVEFVRQRGNVPREFLLSWSGVAGREALESPISVLFSASSVGRPVVFFEEDSIEPTGPSVPTSPLETTYDPILCRVMGSAENVFQSFEGVTLWQMSDGSRGGRRINVGGIGLREIVP